MVSRRGQLILIGALLLATVIFGLSFLLNSILFSGATGVGEADAAVTRTAQLHEEVTEATRPLIVRVNQAQWNITAAELGAAIESNVSRFSRLYAESKAAGGPLLVTVAYDNASSEFGTRIVQAADGPFNRSGTNNWTPVPAPADIGWLTANVNLENTSSSGAWINATNTTGAGVDINLRKNGTNLTVRVNTTWSTPVSQECETTNNRTLLDLYAGSAFVADCSFAGLADLGDGIELQFQDADEVSGRYSIVTNRSLATVPRCQPSVSPSDPCRHDVVWQANLSTVVDGARVSYTDEYNVSIYGVGG